MNHKSRRIIRPSSSPIASILFLLALLGTFGSFSHKVFASQYYDGTKSFTTVVGTSGTMDPVPPSDIKYIEDVSLYGAIYNTGDLEIELYPCADSKFNGAQFYIPQIQGVQPSINQNWSSPLIPVWSSCSGFLWPTPPSDSEFIMNVRYLDYIPMVSSTTMPLSDTHFVLISEIVIAFWSLIFVVSLFKKKI